jgi:glycosyltransferase involved in cell wall biosynthesis
MDRVIAITPEAAKFLMEINVPPGKIAIVTNFVGNLLNGKHLSLSEKNQRWIVTGRLSHEKGFTGLLESLPSDVEIDVVGDGPDLEVLQLKFREKKNIRFLGRIEHDKYLEMLPNYVGGFHSSLWLEHSPLTVIEFLSAGIPFIGLERNTSEKFSEYDCKISLPEFTEGFIQEAIKRIRSSYDSFSNAAVRCFDTEYSEGRWVNQMEKIFEEQIESRK